MTSTPVTRFDHVALAVRSIEQAAHLFRDILGGTFIVGGDDYSKGLRSAQYLLPPGTKIELLQPLSDDSKLASYIEKHGEGFHHATMFFNDIEPLLCRLREDGYETTGTELTEDAWRETYLRLKSGFGALFQFVDTDRDWTTPVPGITEEAVFAGEVEWSGRRPVLKQSIG